MGLTSLQVCMDSSDWFQGTIQEETGMDSSSPSGITDSMLACSRPLMERRLRPPHDQALKCPRCDSTHTKFCYYNNYSLTQPRYFCKTCRRYWTKGGTLRNIPVGGGFRKNKKVSSTSKKCNSATINNNNDNNNDNNIPPFYNPNPNPNPNHQVIMNSTDLQLAYPDTTRKLSLLENCMDISSMQFSGSNLFGNFGNSSNINPSFMFENLNGNATRAIDFMENNGGVNQFMGTAEMGGVNVMGQNYHGGNLCSPFGGMTLDSINNYPFMERELIAYDHEGNDVKPKLLALEWQHQTGATSGGSGGGGGGGGGGYLTGLGSSWGGVMNGYGPATNSLV